MLVSNAALSVVINVWSERYGAFLRLNDPDLGEPRGWSKCPIRYSKHQARSMDEKVSVVVHSTGVADRAYSPVTVIQGCSRHAAPLDAQWAPPLRRGTSETLGANRGRMHRRIPGSSSVCVGMGALATADETVEALRRR
jgi:hypothetical protein